MVMGNEMYKCIQWSGQGACTPQSPWYRTMIFKDHTGDHLGKATEQEMEIREHGVVFRFKQ